MSVITRLIVILSMVFSCVAFSSGEYTKSQIDATMKNNGFPESDYPYYSPLNGCGPGGVGSSFLNNFLGLVDFEKSCNNHDRCFRTMGSNEQQCTRNLKKDMQKDCHNQLSGVNRLLTPACYSVAKQYQIAVTLGSTFNFYEDRQVNQKRYIETLKRLFPSLYKL